MRDVGEEDLVEFGFAGDLEQRPHLDPGRLHVDQERGHPLVLGDIGVGARHDEAEGRDVRQRRPDLLPVEHPLLTVTLGPGREPGHVGPGPGLAEELAPDLLAGEEGAQVALLLLGRPVGGDGRARTCRSRSGCARPPPARRPASQARLRPLLVPGRQTEAAGAGREVQPGQAAVELLPEELLGRRRPRRKVGHQAIDQLVDVRTHARTL